MRQPLLEGSARGRVQAQLCATLLALLVLLGELRAARAQGDFQQRRPSAPPDAGAPRPVPRLTKPPRITLGPNPSYPPAALAARASADVVLQLDLDATGQVSNARIITPARLVPTPGEPPPAAGEPAPPRDGGADSGVPGVATRDRVGATASPDAGVPLDGARALGPDGGAPLDGARALGPDGGADAGASARDADLLAGFDEAALTAVRAMRFEPAEIDGVPAAIRLDYVLRFRPPRLVPVVDAGVGPDGGAAAANLSPPRPTLYPLARGRIRERGTRDPLVDAEVRVVRLTPAPAPGLPAAAASTPPPTAPGVTAAVAPSSSAPPETAGLSDGDGQFVVSGQPGERVRVIIATGAHEPCIRDVVLPDDPARALELDCLVAPLGRTYETVVEAPRRGEEVTRHTLSQPELTSVPGTFGDPLRVIQNLPGVSRAPYGLGLLLIRGASPQDSGVYIDGHRVPLLYHFAVGPSVLTPDLIDKIDFYPGGFGVRYGRASAGVVDVTTRTEVLTRVHGAADVDFLDAGAYLEGPVGGGWTAAGAARRSYIDTLLPMVLPEGETVAAPVYWDYQTRLTRTFAGGERLSFFAFGSRDSLDVLSGDPETGALDLGTSVMFHRVLATWTRNFGAFTSRFSPSYGYDSIGFRAGQVDGAGDAHVIGLRQELTRPFGERFTLVMGLDSELRFDQLEFNVPLPPERRTYGRTRRDITSIARTLTNLGAAAYVEALWDVTSWLRLAPGLRFDWFHYVATDKTTFDPRLVGRLALAETTYFKGGLGVYHQPPTPNQLDAEFGQPNLPIQWAAQYHFGLEHGFTPAISLDTTAYYMRRRDLALPSTRPTGDGGVERFAPEGRARSYGVEVLLKHRPTRNFFGWVAYSLSRAEQRRVNLQATGAATTPYRPTTWDQTHNLTAVASRTLGPWELGARFRLVTGLPDTPTFEGEFDADYNDWDPVQGPAGSTRRQTFHQLDLRVERTFTFDAWRFAAYLDVQNVYNAENPEATVFDFRYRRSAPVRGLPVLPVLGMKGRF